MPRYTGNDGVITVDATAIANVRSWELNIAGDEIDVPAMGDSARVRLPGKPNVDGRVTCWYDPADAGQGDMVQGAEVALELRARGTGSALPEMTLSTARITAENYRIPVDAGMEVEFSFVSDALPDRTAQA